MSGLISSYKSLFQLFRSNIQRCCGYVFKRKLDVISVLLQRDICPGIRRGIFAYIAEKILQYSPQRPAVRQHGNRLLPNFFDKRYFCFFRLSQKFSHCLFQHNYGIAVCQLQFHVSGGNFGCFNQIFQKTFQSK